MAVGANAIAYVARCGSGGDCDPPRDEEIGLRNNRPQSRQGQPKGDESGGDGTATSSFAIGAFPFSEHGLLWYRR